MAKPDVRRTHVAMITEGGQVSAEALTVQMGIDKVATVSVRVHHGDGLIRALTADQLTRMRNYQTRRLQGRTQPDTGIEASDGNGGQLVIEGYLTAPSISMRSGSVVHQVQIATRDAALHNLDLSIYNDLPARGEERSDTEGYTKTPIETTGDVALMLREITDTLMSNFRSTLMDTELPTRKTLLTLKDQINSGAPYAVWSDILSNSDVVFESWKELMTEYPSIASSIIQYTLERLRSPSPSFWSNLLGLMQDFQMFYRPSLSGSGALLRNDLKLADPIEKEIHIDYSSIESGSPELLALAGVVVEGPVLADYREEEQSGGGEPSVVPTVVSAYPEQLAPGIVKHLPPPLWMLVDGKLPFGPTVRESEALNLSLDLFLSEADKVKNRALDVDRTIGGKVLKEYAELVFRDKQLADSTGTLGLPLDFTFEVGKRYRFLLPEGGRIEGFVNSLTHTLETSEGRSAMSGTTLFLTHITF